MEARSTKVNRRKPKHFTEDNFNVNNVDSLRLIREVKKHNVIYDTKHERYHDQPYRADVWREIYLSLYPLYPEYSSALQLKIGVLVRRRWKSVRDYISHEAKLMLTTDYCRTRSIHMTELQFVLPYIKSPYCQKIAAELGIKRLDGEDSNTHDSNTNDDDCNAHSYEYHNENESFLIHEFIKEEESFECYNNDDTDDLNPLPVDKNPAMLMTQSNALVHTVDLHYNANQLSRPPMLTPRPSSQGHCQLPRIESVESFTKRPRNDCCEDNASMDMQRQLLDLLIHIERRQLQAQAENDLIDLDRMFFLSLVPDFKQIPLHKKIFVKAKIASVIAEAMG